MKRIPAIRWTMVWMLVGLLVFVCSCSKTDRARGDGKKNGEVRTITLPGGATMDLVWIEPGTFDMESKEVVLTRGYWIGKTEVTQKQWKSVMGNNPSKFKGDDRPVECVSWNDCQKFLEKLNAMPEVKKSGLTYRLPTEEEWEHACRAGSTGDYCKLADGTEITKETLGTVAWYCDNSTYETQPVGQKKPNAWGLYDMHGNVWEWTSTVDGDDRVLRGGSWDDLAGYCACGYRGRLGPDFRCYDLGLRLVASAGL